MSINLSNKKIIMIHGLASKPPTEDLHELWSKCIVENIRVDDSELANSLIQQANIFETAYWADSVPHHIPDDKNYIKKLALQVDKVVEERSKLGDDGFHVGFGEKVSDFFKDRGIDLVKIVAGSLAVKDDVMKALLREAELYSDDQFIADQMRQPLEDLIRQAWSKSQDIALISHSMGTFISYDVLWRFSHRNVDNFKQYNKRRIQLFVTMGSPLGEPAVQKLLFAYHHKKTLRKKENIQQILISGITILVLVMLYHIRRILMKYISMKCEN